MALGYNYNGIQLQHTRTNSFEMEPEYDPTNTDNVRYKYTIKVRGFVSSGTGNFPGFGGNKQSAVTLNNLKAALETPRRPLEYNIGPVGMVSVPNGIDDKLGPHPLTATVTEPSSGTFMVECGVVTHLYQCSTQCSTGTNPVISLRWTQSESFDENWYSHVKTKGRLMVRASLLESADNFRPLTLPAIENQYKRVSSIYTLSPDGLELEFEYEDVEVDRLPPPPLNFGAAFAITKAAGTFTVQTSAGGGLRTGIVNLTLEGPAGASRLELLIRAISMGYAKLNRDGILDPQLPIKTATFVEDLFTPKVTIAMMTLLNPLTGRGFSARPAPPVMPSVGATDYPQSGLVPVQLPLTPPQRKRLAALAVAAFLDPCACPVADADLVHGHEGPGHAAGPKTAGGSPAPNSVVNIPTLAATGSAPNSPPSAAYRIPTSPYSGQIAGGAIATALFSVAPLGSFTSPYVRDTAPYTYYELESTTTFDSGLVQLPGTGVGPTPNVSAVVSTSGQMMTLGLAWTAQRMGLPPQLPAYLSPDPNIVPLRGAIVTKDVSRTADGAYPRWTISGYYVYAIIDPSLYEIVPPVAPYLGNAVAQAAQLGVSFWTNTAFWTGDQAATAGSNPFTGDVTLEAPPQLPQGFATQTQPTQPGGNVIQSGSGGGGQVPYQPPIGA